MDYLEEILDAFPWWDSLHGIWVKHPKNSITIISNSSVGTSKLVCEFDQAALGTQESSVVSMPPPTLPCDPDDVEDEGVVKVHLKLFKVFYCSCIYTFCQDMTALPSLTPSQTPLQLPLQLLSDLPPDHELYLPEEVKYEVKPICMTTPQALASAASSSSISSPVSTPCSTCSMKTKCDYVADLHEQGQAEQVQTDCEATQLHGVHMARIVASAQREKMRHERRLFKYQLQIEVVKVKTSHPNIFEP